MNTLDKQILDNTLALNHSLIQQNQIYEERIALLESKISSLTPSDTVLQEEDKDNPLSTLLEGIELPTKDGNNPSTSIRATESVVHELEQVKFDLIPHYNKKLTQSQTIEVLINLYNKRK